MKEYNTQQAMAGHLYSIERVIEILGIYVTHHLTFVYYQLLYRTEY